MKAGIYQIVNLVTGKRYIGRILFLKFVKNGIKTVNDTTFELVSAEKTITKQKRNTVKNKLTEETKKRIGEKSRRRIVELDSDGNIINTFNTVRECMNYFKISGTDFFKIINKEKTTKNKTQLKYLDAPKGKNPLFFGIDPNVVLC